MEGHEQVFPCVGGGKGKYMLRQRTPLAYQKYVEGICGCN